MAFRASSPLNTSTVNTIIAARTATVPVTTTGGVYNQASLGTGLTVAVFSSGGVITSILSVVSGGTGYAVGDVLSLPQGNMDAVVRVTNVSGGVVQSGGVSVVYGGTGYTTGLQITTGDVPPGQRTIVFSGVLTSNVTLIIQNGTYLLDSRKTIIVNNSTGAFTTTVFLSNGAGGTVGNGVIIPQGVNASAAMQIFTDGVNDVWPCTTAAGLRGTVTNDNATAGSVGEYVSSNIAIGSAVTLTSNTSVNVTSISLTAGDWDVSGVVFTNPGGTTTQSNLYASISTTTNTLSGTPNESVAPFASPAGQPIGLTTPVVRVSIAATTTIYLVTQSAFAVSTNAAYGQIRARRVR